ncbi:MAG: hypothetical protein L0Y67_05080 [Gammaproteobacteria bacterium]|nr:hypothetical protein [Gammaproteobacteria bacterium]
MELTRAIGIPRHKNLVFTSAGDRANLRRWVSGTRNFDLWITYYGGQPRKFQDVADFYNQRKGSKFQNLHYAYCQWMSIFDDYEAVMVIDDDILINGTRLSRLFEIRKELDLWALQPAFSMKGKISWDITRVRPTTRLRYTNFVEMACPLFRKDKLIAFMEVYDPVLVGYGMDWWFLDAIGPKLERRVAVIDEIVCVNPLDDTKGGHREIDRLQSMAKRMAVWKEVKERHGIASEESGQVEYERVAKTPLGALVGVILLLPEWVRYMIRRLGRRIVRSINSKFRRH